MKKKLAALAFAGATLGLFAAAPSAQAAHYCVDTPSGTHQTNGNGNKGGNDGWRNASAGQERAPGTYECDSATDPVPAPVNDQ